MLTETKCIDDWTAQVGRAEDRLFDLSKTIAAELDGLSRRTRLVVEARLADVKLETHKTMMMLRDLNAARVADESRADGHADVVQVRRLWGILTARSNLLRNAVNQWHGIDGLVRQQLKLRRAALYANPETIPRGVRSQMFAADDIFNELHAMLNPADQSQEAVERNCFADIALPQSKFIEHLHAAYRVRLAQRRDGPTRFLDVGCGGGLKVLSALRFCDGADGLEYDAAYVEAARALLRLDPTADCRILHGDARLFESYADYDIIYFYRPISDHEQLMDMERKITSTARPGTLLIAPYLGFDARAPDLGCARVSGMLHVAGISQRQADALRRKAESIGPFIIKRQSPGLRTVWDPIIAASRARGYDLDHMYKVPQY